MKRFIVTTILTVVIAGVLAHFMPRSFTHYLSKFDAESTVTIYCRQTELNAVDMGGGCGYKVECNVASYLDTAAHCQGIDGVCVSFAGSRKDVDSLCRYFRMQVSSVYEQSGLYVVSGASSKLRGGVTDGENKINLQIAFSNGVVLVGSPLILGDY